jgi:putative FmdB family regulatory protein
MAPMREFECNHCGANFDTLVRTEADLSELQCPKCGATELQQMLSFASNYTIKGNNSASTRPVKSRSNQ